MNCPMVPLIDTAICDGISEIGLSAAKLIVQTVWISNGIWTVTARVEPHELFAGGGGGSNPSEHVLIGWTSRMGSAWVVVCFNIAEMPASDVGSGPGGA